MQSDREEDPFPAEEEEEKEEEQEKGEEMLSPVLEEGDVLEKRSTLPDLECERTKEQLTVYEAQSTFGESACCEKSESLPLLLEGHAQVESVGCELEGNHSFPHLEEPHQRLWRDIRNFDNLGTFEYEGDDEGDDHIKEIKPKQEEGESERDLRKVSTPTSRKWLIIKLLLAGEKILHFLPKNKRTFVNLKTILYNFKTYFTLQVFLEVSGFCWLSTVTFSYQLFAFPWRSFTLYSV